MRRPAGWCAGCEGAVTAWQRFESKRKRRRAAHSCQRYRHSAIRRTDAVAGSACFGATGSVGVNTLELIGRNRADFEVVALTAHRNVGKLAELAIAHDAKLAVIGDAAQYGELKSLLGGTGIEAAAGPDALVEAAERPVDWIMAAIIGAAGLRPTLAAVRAKTCVALANKECLVSAGSLFMRAVAESGSTLLAGR